MKQEHLGKADVLIDKKNGIAPGAGAHSVQVPLVLADRLSCLPGPYQEQAGLCQVPPEY